MNLGPCWAADNRIYFVSDRGGAECVWSAQDTDAPSRVASQADTSPVANQSQPMPAETPMKTGG